MKSHPGQVINILRDALEYEAGNSSRTPLVIMMGITMVRGTHKSRFQVMPHAYD